MHHLLTKLLTSDSFFSADLMDKDIRAALFDGFDEEGEFEELQDDFITQVLLSAPFTFVFYFEWYLPRFNVCFLSPLLGDERAR